MTLRETIQEDTKTAMKSGDKGALSTLRMVSAALKNRKIELMRELTDEDVLAVIRSGIKQRRDSIVQFRDGGRAELAAREEAEVAVLERYLPAQMPDAELDAIVVRAIQDSGATGMKDMGGVMKRVLAEVAGRADGSAVSAKVKQRLS